MEALFTLKEARRLLKVSRSQLYRWVRSGQLPVRKLGTGRLVRIRATDLRKFIKGESNG